MIKTERVTQEPSKNSDCLGVILAGGLSSRMGQDKALLNRNNENMLSFCQQLFNSAGINSVVTSANKNQTNKAYTEHGANILADTMTNAGPLGGIYSVIEQYQPKALLILPVDLPLLTTETVRSLKVAGELSQKACFYQDNFLPLYLPVNAYAELFFQQAFSRFTGKGPSMKALLKAVPTHQLALKNNEALFNTNTPEQWSEAQSLFQKK